ncbi:MAG: accessory factor UbiK family protein [Woeseiaceae bacterium]
MQIPDIDKLIKSVVDNIPGKAGSLNDDIQDYLRQSLSTTLKKMDIVTRHEFDIQAAVLQKTRAKVDEMEEIIKKLESKLL